MEKGCVCAYLGFPPPCLVPFFVLFTQHSLLSSFRCWFRPFALYSLFFRRTGTNICVFLEIPNSSIHTHKINMSCHSNCFSPSLLFPLFYLFHTAFASFVLCPCAFSRLDTHYHIPSPCPSSPTLLRLPFIRRPIQVPSLFVHTIQYPLFVSLSCFT